MGHVHVFRGDALGLAVFFHQKQLPAHLGDKAPAIIPERKFIQHGKVPILGGLLRREGTRGAQQQASVPKAVLQGGRKGQESPLLAAALRRKRIYACTAFLRKRHGQRAVPKPRQRAAAHGRHVVQGRAGSGRNDPHIGIITAFVRLGPIGQKGACAAVRADPGGGYEAVVHQIHQRGFHACASFK